MIDTLISLMAGIISQCITISKHQVVYLKYIHILFVNYLLYLNKAKKRKGVKDIQDILIIITVSALPQISCIYHHGHPPTTWTR